jgi:hypothetical protein
MRTVCSLVIALACTACGDGEGDVDAGRDGGRAASMDAGADAGSELDERDAGTDGGPRPGVLFPPRDFRCAPDAPAPCATTVPTFSDAERTHVVTEEHEDATFAYVFSVLSIPAAEGNSAVGFNIDGIDSGGGSSASDATCEEYEQDFSNVYEPLHPGTDSAFQALLEPIESFLPCPPGADACLDALLQQEINAGTLLIVLEVRGVESLAYDPEVEVSLYSVRVVGGALDLEAGRIAPDQMFDTLAELAEPAAGDIFDGRVRATWPELSLPLMTGGLVLPGELTRAELRADLTESELIDGQIGGAADIQELALYAELLTPGSGELVFSILEGIADVTPSDEDPRACADVSAGLAVSGVRALRIP